MFDKRGGGRLSSSLGVSCLSEQRLLDFGLVGAKDGHSQGRLCGGI
jgi:hypothetical protein